MPPVSRVKNSGKGDPWCGVLFCLLKIHLANHTSAPIVHLCFEVKKLFRTSFPFKFLRNIFPDLHQHRSEARQGQPDLGRDWPEPFGRDAEGLRRRERRRRRRGREGVPRKLVRRRRRRADDSTGFGAVRSRWRWFWWELLISAQNDSYIGIETLESSPNWKFSDNLT